MAAADVHSALLIVIGEPTNEQHPGLILQRVIDGLSTWNPISRGFLDHDKPQVDLSTELRNFLNTNVAPEHLETGGLVLRYSGTHIYVEILINPAVQSLKPCLLHFLTHGSTYKHIIHAGAAFAGSGSWILQDGTLSMQDFSRLLHSPDVSTAFTQVRPGSILVVSCFPEGEWSEHGAKHHGLDKIGHVHLGQLHGSSGIDPSCAADLQAYLHQHVVYTPLETLMPASNVVGSVRFRRPTLHIFPAGQGDAALFGVSGFTILFDGGFSRKTCYWDFLRHVDRVDALLISRISSNNVIGISSFTDRLATSECHPKIGFAFGNIPAYHRSAAGEDPNKNPLLLSLHEQGAKITGHLAHLNLKPHPCASAISPTAKHLEPLTLYQKVGQGRLDMFILNPAKDSKELIEFVDAWKKGVHKHGPSKFSTKPGSGVAEFTPLLVDQTSIAALLVWRPADPNDQIVRVLYPGSCSQEKILLGLDKLKHLDFLKHSTCTPASLESKAAAPKKGLATKAVEGVKSAVEGVKSAVAAVAPKAVSAPKSLAASRTLGAAPKAPEVVAAENHHHHHHPEPAPTAPLVQPDPFELSPIGEPLVNLPSQPVHEVSPVNFAASPAEDVLLGDFAPPSSRMPILQPQHMGGNHIHETSPHDHVSPPGAASEDFIHREQLAAAAEADLLSMERDPHAGFGIAAEPTQATPFEAVDVGHTIKPNVLRLSHDHLDESSDRARGHLIDEPSPVSPNQQLQSELFQHQQPPATGFALDSPLDGGHVFGARDIQGAPTEPEHPHQQQFSLLTHEQLSNLNPDAPVFIPKFGDASPTAESGFTDVRQPLSHRHHEHTTSPMDPFSEKGFGDGAHIQPQFSNGSGNPFENNAWPKETVVPPKRAAETPTNFFGEVPAEAQRSPERPKQNVEDVMKEWGHPLGLPAPATKAPQHGAASATKPKANGPASGASKEQTNKSATSSAATTSAKRTTVTTVTKTSTAAKTPTANLESKAASAPSTKKSPTSATPKTGTTATKPTAAARPSSGTTTKPSPTARPSSTTATAPKPAPATAAPARATAASKKPGPPGPSYYVDLTYIPHQGNPHYVNADFFKHVRSKHYILSSLHPSNDVLESLLIGKKAWNLPEEEVTLIPTYDSDTLNLWMALHKDELASESIDVAPSCCRCTVNLEEHQGAKCAAYRLEL